MKIVVFAYACEPGSGSEPGAGWAFARMLARTGDTWVLTRSNNREAIERGLAGLPEHDRLRFVYVDLPSWARMWKRGTRGVLLYSVLWQWAALRRARRIEPPEGWDLTWHATLANAWLGSVAPLAGRPAVLGPVGGGVSVPLRAYPALGLRGIVSELVRTGVRGTCRYANPLARLAWRRSDLILTQNPETRDWFPRRHRAKAIVFPHVALGPDAAWSAAGARTTGGIRTAVFAGRLLPWKGVWLAMSAVAKLPVWTLEVLGSGKDRPRLEALAAKLGVADRVIFRGQLPRAEALEVIRRADAFLFPSLREEAGWAVAEAIAAGLPTISLARGGPPVLGARAVPLGSLGRMVADIARELDSPSSAGGDPPAFDLDTRAELLRDHLLAAGLLPVHET
jgi:glycosyltransferase involved in cell wall biosynthesis